MHFDSLQYMSVISELFRPVEIRAFFVCCLRRLCPKLCVAFAEFGGNPALSVQSASTPLHNGPCYNGAARKSCPGNARILSDDSDCRTCARSSKTKTCQHANRRTDRQTDVVDALR